MKTVHKRTVSTTLAAIAAGGVLALKHSSGAPFSGYFHRREICRSGEGGTAMGKLIALFIATGVALGTGTATTAQAQGWAAPAVGCETVDWGFLGFQQRTICDGPRRADGSWTRARVIWTPAGYVPRTTSCGSYSCSSSGGYYREETVQAKETYIVFDHNVLQGEPGWLPPGTDIIR